MAGFSLGDDDELISDINITPFVDVVLVLLIIFMVTTNIIVKAAIEVELPKSATAESIKKPTLAIVVACVGEGPDACVDRRIYLNDTELKPRPEDGLDTDLKVLRFAVNERVTESLASCEDQEKPEETCGLQALITADSGLRYSEVVLVIDAVKLGRASSFALNSELFTDGE